MSVTQVKQALGGWSVRLRGNIPTSVLTSLVPFGHVAIIPGSLNVQEYGDALLDAARYVGVYRTKANNNDGVVISGVGLESWLGDEDGAGDVFETPLVFEADTFATVVAAALPPNGSITAGTIHSVPGTYDGRHQWVTPRTVLNYVMSIFGNDVEWRVNPNGTLDAGTIAQLYSTTPKAILVAKEDSSDLRYRALPGSATMTKESAGYTTRVVVLAEGEASDIDLGEADAPVVPYKDIHGNTVVVTRVISESFTEGVNADTRASVLLDQFGQASSPSVNLSTSTYDIRGNVQVGDYIYVYNPANGFEDITVQETWNGEIINPVKLRVVELSWPIREGWTVAYRDGDGVWTDLSPYVFYETGDTNIIVGNLPRSVSGGVSEPVGIRPNLPTSPASDSTVPAAPAFTAFQKGVYQSSITNTTKAVMRVTWSTPLNTDASTIIDGAFYDLRWRVSQVIGYDVAWSDVNGSAWSSIDGNPWATPLSDPVTTSPEWNYMQIGWGTNTATILELSPGVEYEFQIRAVDAAYPPHYGAFSASTFEITTGDLLAPSAPAAPVVAASRIAVQVQHSLGKNSGGTFNLEPDLDHLEIHLGGSDSFFPDDSTKLGKLPANIGMMTAGVIAVGTFQVEQTHEIHIKVVAVDRAGNRSEASPSATVTAELIDDAHISDLTVSKLTAGTITANILLASEIEVGVGGTITTTDGQFITKNLAGDHVVEMGLLQDGSYGLAAVNEFNQLVPLSRLAFGVRYAYQHDLVNRSSTSYGDPISDSTGLVTVGPELDDIWVGDLGLMLLFLTAHIFVAHSGAAPIKTTDAYVSFEVINKATGAVVQNPSDSWAAKIGHSNTISLDANVATIYPITGLTPGFYKVIAKYRTIDGQMGKFENIGMIVFPF